MILTKVSARFRTILLISFIFLLPGTIHRLNAQAISRDLDVSLLINQVGYTPDAEKFCIAKGQIKRDFEVIDLKTLEVVHKGVLQPNQKNCRHQLMRMASVVFFQLPDRETAV